MSEINYIEEIPEGTFPINVKMVAKDQRTEPSIMSKYKYGTYHKGYLRGVININVILITCEDKIVIQKILQMYVLHWYYTYLLHP